MKRLTFFVFLAAVFFFSNCSFNKQDNNKRQVKIIFLHHSTGNRIWLGDLSSILSKIRFKITHQTAVTCWFKKYNKTHHTSYMITDRFFPKKRPYGWKNYPYDYYNIWVKHGGDTSYMEEPTLAILTKEFNVIIWKHCFPVSNILPDDSIADIDSEKKTLGNYKLQYEALKKKMHAFPETKFIVWTGAALVKEATTEGNAQRAKSFFEWVRNEWDEPGDNIFLWDFYKLETEGGLYMKDEYASGRTDSHPNPSFSKNVYPLFCQRITDIIETGGMKTTLTGMHK
jgi:hypothetical protein